ncbi:hypothetical protein HYU19_03275 [Candidatus Woesearchaeota archaeon]|nr:hypothetical protein [Candidatus Woesearchaeota archaeon]
MISRKTMNHAIAALILIMLLVGTAMWSAKARQDSRSQQPSSLAGQAYQPPSSQAGSADSDPASPAKCRLLKKVFGVASEACRTAMGEGK